MGGPIPVNLASLSQTGALVNANRAVGKQVAAEDSMMSGAQDSFNSMAASRAQSRYDKFKSLDARRTNRAGEEQEASDVKKVEGAGDKGEEDLADQFNKRNYELSPAKLKGTKAKLSQEQTEEEIYEMVTSSFEDPTLADEALEYLEQSTTGPLKEKVSRVRQLLNQEKKREIIGGKNIDAASKDFAARGYGASPAALRELYSDVTGTERDHNTLFNMLANQYPFDELKEIVSFLLKGMAYDVKSKGPSIPNAELMRLMKETKNLQSVLWVYMFFKERTKMMRNIYGRYGMSYPDDLDFEDLAKSFMKLVNDRYPSMMKIMKEAERIGLLDDLEKSIVLSQYRDAIRGLSPRLYHSIRHKQDLLVAMIETLESLEEEEEEEEE